MSFRNIDALLDPRQFNFTGTFDEQAVRVLHSMRLNQEELESLEFLYIELSEVFHQICTGAVVSPFGGVMYGLGIVSSDINCNVKLPDGRMSQVLKYLKKASILMNRQRDKFRDVCPVTEAQLPLLSFYHVPTRKTCSVTFNCEVGVVNSKFLSYFLRMDHRALPLTVLVKYWAIVNNLTPNIINTYTMTLLVINYLQYKDVLPPVHLLENRRKKNMINGWNTAFLNYQPKYSNFESLYQLLGEFFTYYRDFNFNNIIVSPYLGIPIKKDCFVHMNKLPKKFSLYKKNITEKISSPLDVNFWCIQDPFMHNVNLAAGLTEQMIYKLQQSFDLAADTYEADEESMFFRRTLLDCTEYSQRPGKKPRKPVRAKTKKVVKMCKIPAKCRLMSKHDIRALYPQIDYYQSGNRL